MTTEATIDASKAGDAKRTSKTITGVSTVFIEESITVNVEPLKAQNSTDTRIQSTDPMNSAKSTLTPGPVLIVRKLKPRSEGSSGTLPGTAIGCKRLPPTESVP